MEEAISSYHQALAVKPDFAEPHNNLGIALMVQNKMEEAISSYRRALAVKPDFLTAHSNLLFSLNYLPRPNRFTLLY